MATLTLNGREITVDDGRPLVEVIKEHGVAITNLCYIDGLEAYAGCRTCLVEIEGARPPIQVSCTMRVADGMVVNTETPQVKQARQGVLSIINANHPDRCLTCHRRVHCQPGEICLRDDIVTHRCLTCSKNYRCELQTANEMLDMGEFDEPWVGEARSYYESPPPEPDRANPYLEFDPQMCIICTRCVRACADLRHTSAISLAGKGFGTRIAFGTGGAVHESDCDFCGACIDVCPTATLMEKPNKWIGRAEEWTNSACNSCAVACTISYGTAGGRPVIVRPDPLNPVSRDQICVRGRFGYAAVGNRERLTRSLLRRDGRLVPAPRDEAFDEGAQALIAVKREHGAEAIAVLGSPLATNEEAHLLAKLARAVIGTPHVDFSHGPLHRAVAGALRDAFGLDRLPASLTEVERASTIVVVAGDIEESHQLISLRVKDAVVNNGAKLVLVSPRWGELVPFAEAWLRPTPGHEAVVVQSLAQAAAGDKAARATLAEDGVGDVEALGEESPPLPGVDDEALVKAIEAVQAARADGEGFALVFAPDAVSAQRAAQQARACANLALAVRGVDAPAALHYLPTDANVLGISDMGIAPREGGKSFPEIVRAARDGEIRALLIHRDNPLLNAPGSDDVAAALDAVETLIVIDGVRSTTAERAAVVLAEAPFFASDGTITSADRRVVRHHPAACPRGEQLQGAAAISALADALGGLFQFESGAAVMTEISETVAGYLPDASVESGRTRVLDHANGARPRFQAVAAAPDAAGEGLAVITGRSLYTSWEGASMRSEEADMLHREEAAVLNPLDAQAAAVETGDEVVLSDGTHELRLRARLDDGVAPGTVYVPHYFDGGAVMSLFPLDGDGDSAGQGMAPPTVRLHALQPA